MRRLALMSMGLLLSGCPELIDILTPPEGLLVIKNESSCTIYELTLTMFPGACSSARVYQDLAVAIRPGQSQAFTAPVSPCEYYVHLQGGGNSWWEGSARITEFEPFTFTASDRSGHNIDTCGS